MPRTSELPVLVGATKPRLRGQGLRRNSSGRGWRKRRMRLQSSSSMKASTYIRSVLETAPDSCGQLLLPVRCRSSYRTAQPQASPYLSAMARALRDLSAKLSLRKLPAHRLDDGGTRTRTVPARSLGRAHSATHQAPAAGQDLTAFGNHWRDSHISTKPSVCPSLKSKAGRSFLPPAWTPPVRDHPSIMKCLGWAQIPS